MGLRSSIAAPPAAVSPLSPAKARRREELDRASPRIGRMKRVERNRRRTKSSSFLLAPRSHYNH